MFFTRYWRDRIESLEGRISGLTADVAALRGELKARDELIEAHSELIKSFQKLQQQYSDGLDRARQLVEEAQREAQPPTFSNRPLHYSEEQEDIKYMVDNGLIDEEELKNILEQAGLDEQISLDSS